VQNALQHTTLRSCAAISFVMAICNIKQEDVYILLMLYKIPLFGYRFLF